VHVFIQPLFQSGSFFLEEFGFGKPTRQKTEAFSFGFYELSILIFCTKQSILSF